MAGTKNVKNTKKKRRLKRSIRKTLGALFMATAIAVAAIPVDGLQADNGNNGIATMAAVDHTGHERITPSQKPESTENWIPQIDYDTPIYTTEDKLFRFAYIRPGNAGVPVAMLLGYDRGYVEGKSVEVPNTVEAYAQYTTVQGTDGGYAAVGVSGNFLFYRNRVNREAPVSSNPSLEKGAPNYISDVQTTNKDTDGDGIGDTPYYTWTEETGSFLVCELDRKSEWKDIDDKDLYYYKDFNTKQMPNSLDASNYAEFVRISAGEGISTYGHIRNANVAYIGNQVIEYDSANHKWKWNGKKVTAANPEDGVFAGTSNIVKLEMGKQFRGVGDYAFYGSGITSIKIENGLDTIAEGAFKNCIRLTNVNIDVDAPLGSIGAEAFYNCAELTTISLPWSVVTLGDSVFEKCIKMTTIDLCSEKDVTDGSTLTNLLAYIGRDAFKDCEMLTSITFPSTFHNGDGKMYMSAFEGCSSLKFITARDPELTFVEEICGCGEVYYGYAEFKAMLGEGTKVNGDFYFEGLADSALHRMCHNNCFAFSYLTKDDNGNFIKEDRYEITLPDVDDPVENGRNTYVVTSKNNLVSYTHEGYVETISIPVKIGPYTIETLDPDVIANQCHIRTVILANSVTGIGERAFQGCHNLNDVIFLDYDLDNGDNVSIGANAFWSQHFTGTAHTCADGVQTDPNYEKGPMQKLHFTGPISSTFGPFVYAMSEGGKYSDGTQAPTYITYYSGWPSNLEIKYNPTTKMSELVDFPAMAELGPDKYSPKNYKYMKLPDTEIDESYEGKNWTIYEAAMNNAYYQYWTNPSNLTPYQKELIDATLNIVIPDGVDTVKEGLFYAKEKLDIDAADGKGLPSVSSGNAVKPSSVPDKTVTAYSLLQIDRAREFEENGTINIQPGTGTFAGCEHISDITINSRVNPDGTNTGLISVGDHAFYGCKGLKTASLPVTLKTMGVCPFYKCENMSYVNFQNNPDFICEDSVIFGPDSMGTPQSKIIECLEGIVVKYVETAQIGRATELGEEAFRNTDVKEVDLSGTSITTIPNKAFAETKEISKISLPSSLNTIEDYAFVGSAVDYFSVNNTGNMRVGSYAFEGLVKKDGTKRDNYQEVLWYCADGTVAEEVGELWKFTVRNSEVTYYYQVIFRYYDNERQEYVQSEQRDENGDWELVASMDEVKYPATVGSEVTMEGVTYILTSWELAASADTWFFSAKYDRPQWKVTFMNNDGSVIAVKGVVNRGSAMDVAPQPGVDFTVPEGLNFMGWKVGAGENLSCVVSDMNAIADYGLDGDCLVQYYVKNNSINSEWTLFYSQTVRKGEVAPDIYVACNIPGYHIEGWDRPISDPIVENTKFYANYVPGAGNGGNGSNPNDPTGSGNSSGSGNTTTNPPGTSSDGLYTLTVLNGVGAGRYPEGAQVVISAAAPLEGQEFEMWSLLPADTIISDANRSQAIITMPKGDVAAIANYKAIDPANRPASGDLHTLTVQNGSGSGSYVAGKQVIVTANNPPKGQEFSSWTVSPSDTVVTDKTLSAVVVTMPDNDVAMIANYRAKTTTTGTGNTGTSNSRYPSSSGSAGHTMVVIDKNGISNTVVADATVNGSSDNFVIKVSASTDAEAAALRALMAEYGSVDNIKYVAMDISLYDSTGTKKITDTSGLSIDITLPIPDSLISYAGNNKVAGVVNDRLDKLSGRFTTINGVSCIVFRAEHFSPYLIYVDTNNMTGGTVSDSTPKTGDIVHPKWFLSIGLASLSFVMFMQKDSRKKGKKKQKVAVRAR